MSKGESKSDGAEEKGKKPVLKSYSRVNDIKDLYDKRYSNEELGKLSPYLSRFDPEYLIVSGEEKVFMAGLAEIVGSNPTIRQLDSISKKIELWKKLKSGIAVEDVSQEVRNSYERDEPLVITAVDFGCGDGRSLELWQKMADKLKDFGITLRVKFYDVSEVGLTSLKSRLMNPVVPEKYSDSLREIYGKEIYNQKLQEEDFPTQQDIEDLKKFYGEKIYNENLKLGNIPITNRQISSKEDSEWKSIYEEKNNKDSFVKISVAEEEQEKILGEIYEKKDKNNSHDIKASLVEEYGRQYWNKRGADNGFLTKEDVRNLKNIYGKESYERRLIGNDFPNADDYEKLEQIYGYKEIFTLKEKMPKFVKIGHETKTADQSNVICLGTYRYRNFEAEILFGNVVEVTPSNFKEAVGVVDMSLILYGSTSHIPDKDLRREFIKAIIENTTGTLVATLPGRQGRTKEVAEAIERTNDGSEIEIKVIELKGDHKTMPYGIYTHQTLTALLNEVYDELEKDDVGKVIDRSNIQINVATKRNPADISKNWTDYLVDAMLTPVANVALNVSCAPDSIKDARYFGVVVPGVAPKTSVKVTTYNPMHGGKETEL